jgi:eukaryotic-like serine/threonine-protein kinase
MRDSSRAANAQPDKYEVLRPIATGGMAEVYLARTRDTGRLVVLKKLHPRLAIEREYVQMFRDEAVIASKLQHPNLVEVYELGLDGEEHYIAMEYLHGYDLSRTLRKMRHQRMPLMFQQGIAIVRDVAAGLHYAHERIGDDGNLLNIIHRDISPHNVILTYSGEVKVLDFGIAKASSQVARTRTGVLKGKAAYMSPEQAMGEGVDRRTDVFSMGILLWEVTTGRWLYRRKSELETLKAVVETDAPRPSTIRADYPKDLEKIVMKTLERSPAKRWATAGELRGALDELARSWKFRPGPPMISKLMATVFAERATAWETARAAGISLADHLATSQADPVERWEDTLGTDPEEAVALETRRAPIELKEQTDPQRSVRPIHPDRPSSPERPNRPTRPGRPARSTQSIRALQRPQPGESTEVQPWWQQHRRTLVSVLVAVAIASAIGAIIALASGRGAPRPLAGGSTAPGPTPPLTETLEIKPLPTPPDPEPTPTPRPRPRSRPTPDTMSDTPPDAKVPIVHPPPMPDPKKPGRT